MDWPTSSSATLQNEQALLRPVTEQDRQPLAAIALDPAIWRFFVVRISDQADFDAFFDAALTDLAAGRRAPYTILDRRTDQVAGSMSFGNLAAADRRLEIGWSWLGRAFQGTGMNRCGQVPADAACLRAVGG